MDKRSSEVPSNIHKRAGSLVLYSSVCRVVFWLLELDSSFKNGFARAKNGFMASKIGFVK